MLKLLKAILSKNEHAAYTALANINWNKTKTCHVEVSGLSRFKHAIQSICVGYYFLKCALFCLIWHPIFPNINSKYATKQLTLFDNFYKKLNERLRNV